MSEITSQNCPLCKQPASVAHRCATTQVQQVLEPSYEMAIVDGLDTTRGLRQRAAENFAAQDAATEVLRNQALSSFGKTAYDIELQKNWNLDCHLAPLFGTAKHAVGLCVHCGEHPGIRPLSEFAKLFGRRATCSGCAKGQASLARGLIIPLLRSARVERANSRRAALLRELHFGVAAMVEQKFTLSYKTSLEILRGISPFTTDDPTFRSKVVLACRSMPVNAKLVAEVERQGDIRRLADVLQREGVTVEPDLR